MQRFSLAEAADFICANNAKREASQSARPDSTEACSNFACDAAAKARNRLEEFDRPGM